MNRRGHKTAMATPRRRAFSPPLSPVKRDDANGLHRTPFVIGVAGGTASGKTSVCEKIMEAVGQRGRVSVVSQDSFYKDLTEDEQESAHAGEYNFDHPDAFDTDLMKTTLENILDCRTVNIPVYDFKTHSRKGVRALHPVDVVLFEGILVLYDPDVREMLHMKLFVDTDSDTRLSRRVLRDINERGRDLEQILHQYVHYVKPAFEEFTLPTKKYADVIIPRGAENTVAINLIVQHIKDILSGNIDPTKKPGRKRVRRVSDSLLARPH